ncbi:MAG: hypothetical protein JW807_10530 [Spirochaetes bacterium]|nr:hypothetical protein [Spirochaetota bacterium]
MKKSNQETLLIEKLLEKYRLTRPISPKDRDAIISSKRKILKRVLKTVGAFSALYGLYLSLYFAVKKAGIGVILKTLLTCALAGSLAYGGYRAVKAVRVSRLEQPSGREAITLEDIRARYKWVDQIILYNGKIIRGAIISRGASYEILTTRGIVQVPRNQIKMVKPLKTGE